MAKQLADVQIHAADSQESLEDDNLDVSVDLIDEGLYLGNLACARDNKTLEKLQITHILTIDLVPLPRTILDRGNLTFKYVKLADVPKEDLISQLPDTNEFIKEAIASGGVVLVHCYFGVSRSAAVVIAYIMEKYGLCYEDAFNLVKSKRRFVHPNIGFAAQLKLFGHMGYKLNKDDPRFKQFRLKMGGQKLKQESGWYTFPSTKKSKRWFVHPKIGFGAQLKLCGHMGYRLNKDDPRFKQFKLKTAVQKLKQVKILPQLFADLIKPDPGLVRERPDPKVYRCKKCRRIVASQSNIIPHIPKQVKVELAKKGIRPPPSKLTGLNCAENGEILIEKLKSLASQILDMRVEDASSDSNSPGHSQGHSHDSDEGPSQVLDGYSEGNLVDGNIAARDSPEVCRLMWFVEPMAWMKDVQHETQGKLHCPKCQNKIGSFNWVMGCKCPCGQKVAPAFYLVPSKVEWSNIVQNVQVTL